MIIVFPTKQRGIKKPQIEASKTFAVRHGVSILLKTRYGLCFQGLRAKTTLPSCVGSKVLPKASIIAGRKSSLKLGKSAWLAMPFGKPILVRFRGDDGKRVISMTEEDQERPRWGVSQAKVAEQALELRLLKKSMI